MSLNLEITGNIRDRFIQVVTLLHHLDPVRGERTAYGLDQDSQDPKEPKEQMLKRKFLDSFALICATKQDKESVSAACLEEEQPGGTVIRIASNAGVSEETMSRLQNILGLLSGVASKAAETPKKETEILFKIIQLDIEKIRGYVKTLQTTKDISTLTIPILRARLEEVLPHSSLPSIQLFLDWIGEILSTKHLSSEPDVGILSWYINWAKKSNEFFRHHLRAAFSKGDQSQPRWVSAILKLGRYSIAARAFVRIASDLPDLFNPISVKAVDPPPKAQYSIRNEIPLTSVLRRVNVATPEDVVASFATKWKTSDAEAYFRKMCPKDLITHAELQLINFYEINPQRKPRNPFIGVSKKSCYLCFEFLAAHAGGFYVSSCHQKLYPSWIPAPAADNEIYNRYKAIIQTMSTKMEGIAREDIVTNSGAKRFPIPADSTAGVSLTGLTDLRSVGIPDNNGARRGVNTDTGYSYATSHLRAADSQITSHSVNFEPQSPDSRRASVSEMNVSGTRQQFARQGVPVSASSMVFHLKHKGNEKWQDIITIGSIFDPQTQSPSWSRLVELLNEDHSSGLTFGKSTVLMINDRIRVSNERQFIASLQYLLNAGDWNAVVTVCDESSVPQSSGLNGRFEVH